MSSSGRDLFRQQDFFGHGLRRRPMFLRTRIPPSMEADVRISFRHRVPGAVMGKALGAVLVLALLALQRSWPRSWETLVWRGREESRFRGSPRSLLCRSAASDLRSSAGNRPDCGMELEPVYADGLPATPAPTALRLLGHAARYSSALSSSKSSVCALPGRKKTYLLRALCVLLEGSPRTKRVCFGWSLPQTVGSATYPRS